VRAARARRLHAARVAATATLMVLTSYVIGVFVLNTLVVHRLTANTDARLVDSLRYASQRTLTISKTTLTTGHHDQDRDDAPTFVWSVAPNGAVTPLTQRAPSLPRRQWNDAPLTLPIGTTHFRFDVLESQGVLLVAGQSVASISGVRSALILPEFIFGLALLIVLFPGALVIGLRASAPSELIRLRQAEFTADASHELRTPLSVIEAEVELALRRKRDPASYEGVLRRVAQESLRLRRIVEDLLWLARVDNESSSEGAGDGADVAEIAETCAERFQAVATTRDVTLSVRREGEGPFNVQAAPEWIDRLAGVLLDNACKFAGMGGSVEIRVRAMANRVELRVDDSGPGIAADQREAVFDRFHRATDTVTGTGLGLAIADSVVRATNGTWAIGDAALGGARMEVSWRKAPGRKGAPPTSR